jgi:hypothetical protein
LLQFDSAKGYIYTKKVNFVVKDTEHDDIRVYRVVHKNNDQISKINCFKENGEINDYITSRSRTVYKNGELGYPGSKYINYIPALKKDTINIPKLYKNNGDFNNETDYAEYLRGCISDLDRKNIDDIRNQIINKHDGVCTNHLLIINCRMTKIDSIANADKVSTELFYIDNNVYDENNRVWNNTDDGPLGYKLSNRSVYHKKTINHWKDIYAAIEENYKIVHLWKGVHNPNIVGSYYLICVSKKFGFNLDQLLYKIGSKSINALKYFKDNYMMNLNEYSNSAHLYNNYIYRDDNIFVPCYHELVELNASREQDINKFTVTDKDALCVIPTIERSKNLSGYSWEFINMSDPNRNSIKLKNSIMEPFIANETEKFLDPGYYTIKFNYNLGSKVNTITLDSAFKKI